VVVVALEAADSEMARVSVWMDTAAVFLIDVVGVP
jgi:hypothetical protein